MTKLLVYSTFILLFSACGVVEVVDTPEAVMPVVATNSAIPATPTDNKALTQLANANAAVVDAQATSGALVIVAQNAQGTANALESQMLSYTHAVEQNNHELDMAQIALEQSKISQANTVVAATITARPVYETQRAHDAQIESFIVTNTWVDKTATAEYPHLVREVRYAENIVPITILQTAAACLVAMLVTGALLYALYYRSQHLPEESEDEDDEHYGHARFSDQITFYFTWRGRSWNDKISASRVMLDEFADRMVIGGPENTLAIDKWRGSNTNWTEEAYKDFRDNFLVKHGFAFLNNGNGKHELSDAGLALFTYVSSSNPESPIQYRFDAETFFCKATTDNGTQIFYQPGAGTQ